MLLIAVRKHSRTEAVTVVLTQVENRPIVSLRPFTLQGIWLSHPGGSGRLTEAGLLRCVGDAAVWAQHLSAPPDTLWGISTAVFRGREIHNFYCGHKEKRPLQRDSIALADLPQVALLTREIALETGLLSSEGWFNLPSMLGPERAFGGEGVAWVTPHLQPSSLAACRFIPRQDLVRRHLLPASSRSGVGPAWFICGACMLRGTGRMSELAAEFTCLVPAGRPVRLSGLSPDTAREFLKGLHPLDRKPLGSLSG
jgi:hypothetical protein